MTYAFLSLHQQHKRTKGLIDIHRVPEKKSHFNFRHNFAIC